MIPIGLLSRIIIAGILSSLRLSVYNNARSYYGLTVHNLDDLLEAGIITMKITLELLSNHHLDAQYLLKNDPNVLKDIPGDYPLAKTAFNKKHLKIIDTGQTNEQGSFSIFVDDEPVGMIGYFKRDDSDDVEVGYYIGHKWWGKGIATRSLEILISAMRDFGIREKVHAMHAAENIASGCVLEKVGCLERLGT